jgi:hypothetical protein
MAGNEHIPTAPHEVIGDDGDLRIMRKALREGKHVTLAPDGKVYVSSDAGTPMSETNEAFIESKLGHVIELARSGYGVGVKPDGTIFADRADHLAKVMYDPDPALSEQQRLLIRQGVAEGAHVQVHADGRVEYFRARDAVRPPAAQASRLQEAIDEQISSGRLLTEMRSGLSLSANPDGSLDYRRVDPGPEPVLFPEDRVILDTASEFETEAAELELGAGAARIGGLEDYLHGERAAAGKRDEAGRGRAAAEGAASEAGRQADVAEQRANELSRAETEAWQKAAAAKQAGNATLAAEATEQANALHVMLITARLEGESAREAEAANRAAAAGHAEQEQRFDDDSRAVRRRAKELEDVFDAQEDQAREYRTAAAELREAERLEAALPDLESRGVAGVERIREAAAEHRRLATEAAERGNAYDQPPALQPDPATPTAPSAPAEPTGPVTKPPPFHDDLRDYSELDDAGDPLDDTAFVDPSEPPTQMAELDVPEIEMPPMDLSADVDDVSNAADVASFGADGVDGVDGGPTAFG